MVEPVSGDALRALLLPWFRQHARDLPWRRDPSPYHVLLSELMLQQTRVDTVRPYFARFVARWPTLDAFAAASQDDVLTMWAGLGYYRRARSLHDAARAAVAAGGLSRDPAALQKLPGIGPYTAGAIASIAFGVPAAAVDGNVERVLSRLDAVAQDPRSPAGRRALAARVAQITAPGVAGDVTQALMELGATVCSPRSPDCAACPWGGVCVARQTGRQLDYPKLPARKAPTAVRGAAGILRRDGRILCGRRGPGLLGGLWEPVSVDLGADEDAAACLRGAFAVRAGVAVFVGHKLGQLVHVFTHRRLTLDVFEVQAVDTAGFAGDGSYVDLAWRSRTDAVGWSKLALKIFAVAESAHGADDALPFAG